MQIQWRRDESRVTLYRRWTREERLFSAFFVTYFFFRKTSCTLLSHWNVQNDAVLPLKSQQRSPYRRFYQKISSAKLSFFSFRATAALRKYTYSTVTCHRRPGCQARSLAVAGAKPFLFINLFTANWLYYSLGITDITWSYPNFYSLNQQDSNIFFYACFSLFRSNSNVLGALFAGVRWYLPPGLWLPHTV